MASVPRTVLHNTFLTLPASASDFDLMEDLPLPPEMVDWDSYTVSDYSDSPWIKGVRPSHPSVRFTLSDAELLGFSVPSPPVIPESESQQELREVIGGIFRRLEEGEHTEVRSSSKSSSHCSRWFPSTDVTGPCYALVYLGLTTFQDETEESVPEAAGPSASTRESSHPSTPSAGSSPCSSFTDDDDDTPDSSIDAISTPYEMVFIPKGSIVLDKDLPSPDHLPSVLLPSSHLPSPGHRRSSFHPPGGDDFPRDTPGMPIVISSNVVADQQVETTVRLCPCAELVQEKLIANPTSVMIRRPSPRWRSICWSVPPTTTSRARVSRLGRSRTRSLLARLPTPSTLHTSALGLSQRPHLRLQWERGPAMSLFRRPFHTWRHLSMASPVSPQSHRPSFPLRHLPPLSRLRHHSLWLGPTVVCGRSSATRS